MYGEIHSGVFVVKELHVCKLLQEIQKQTHNNVCVWRESINATHF